MDQSRVPFLIASHDDARREQLFWEEHRDRWLKLVLLAQAILFALASGIEVAGVRVAKPETTADPYHVLLLLAPVVSMILYLMFLVEDRLVGLLGHHAAQISGIE